MIMPSSRYGHEFFFDCNFGMCRISKQLTSACRKCIYFLKIILYQYSFRVNSMYCILILDDQNKRNFLETFLRHPE